MGSDSILAAAADSWEIDHDRRSSHFAQLATMAPHSSTGFRFLDLPPEIQNQIYFVDIANHVYQGHTVMQRCSLHRVKHHVPGIDKNAPTTTMYSSDPYPRRCYAPWVTYDALHLCSSIWGPQLDPTQIDHYGAVSGMQGQDSEDAGEDETLSDEDNSEDGNMDMDKSRSDGGSGSDDAMSDEESIGFEEQDRSGASRVVAEVPTD